MSALDSLWEVCLSKSTAQMAGGLQRLDLALGERAGNHKISIRVPSNQSKIQGRILALGGKLKDKSNTYLQLLFAKCR